MVHNIIDFLMILKKGNLSNLLQNTVFEKSTAVPPRFNLQWRLSLGCALINSAILMIIEIKHCSYSMSHSKRCIKDE